DSVFPSLGTKPYVVDDLSVVDQVLHEQLLTAGITQPKLSTKNRVKIRVIPDSFLDSTQNPAIHITRVGDYDLLFIIRENQTYAELLQELDYQSITQPHVLIDLANHEHVSVGPLVFPSETACLACLQGRIEHRWGDTKPPKSPRATQAARRLAQSMIELEAVKFLEQNYALIGKTLSMNMTTYQTNEHALYKVSYCPICKKPAIDRLKNLS
ncbi:TOMM precursor leader peptide-binding protein, partial [Candidatus Saccharibacteria bacterium]|nr:TOMM precursor leader peptide-binding protein [Candidatus Saccharibacteria bacterium]